jgi:hypothetical protein
MKIFVLAEPRSGSTNLAKWFGTQKDFTVFIEPLNPVSIHYKHNKNVFNWGYETKNILIKEVFYPNSGERENVIKSLIDYSDKTIILYREDKIKQFESWLSALKTKNWGNKWVMNDMGSPTAEEKNYFNKLINEFKIGYIDNPLFFSISYEELYETNDGIFRLLDFIGLDGITNEGFPLGERYRTIKVIDKLI